ncbi:hypothetical protein F5J12DRAFT_7781 [Pisolithus orientalis]|uniref:uncharacterized protein n=1 Tax=Pisolithus orientalis TaxID=936130 RepID=UPI0022252CF7|nr:uncharacterized protein F5J12DRAFT_7781 [Pisolithus orientalis]KAI6034998.1 hypothetical protein F5J12DRAFT_7781 [Pisolithus orientalis]
MCNFACIVKPLAYISLPFIILRSIASNSPTGRYYWRLTVFLGTLVVASTWGVVVAVGMTLIGRRNDVNYIVARTFYAVASYALDITVEVEGEEHLQTRPAVMVANHQSMLDILYLGRMFPQKAAIMAKRELQWTPLGPWMFMSGAVFIDRGNSSKARASLEAAGEKIKSKRISLMMYPEGTRHCQEEPSLLPFKKGAFHMAAQAGIPIIPVVCENYWRIYHKGVFDTGTIKLRVLPPISTVGLTVADVSELAARVRDQMLDTLREISAKVTVAQESDEIQQPTPELKPSLAKEEDIPIETNKVLPSVLETPSEGTSETSEVVKVARSLRLDGSVSEYGGETDDEGNVLVGRRDNS